MGWRVVREASPAGRWEQLSLVILEEELGGGVSSGRTDKIKGVTGKEVEFKFGSFQRVTLSLPHTYFSLWLCLLILFTSAQVL